VQNGVSSKPPIEWGPLGLIGFAFAIFAYLATASRLLPLAVIGWAFLVVGLIWGIVHVYRYRQYRFGAILFALAFATALVATKGHSAAVPLGLAEKPAPPSIPFAPFSGSRIESVFVRRSYEGRCLTISYRDRSDSGGHVCEDKKTHRILDPCYDNAFVGYGCYSSPWDDPAIIDQFIPTDGTVPPQPWVRERLKETKGYPWGIVLLNGEHCIFSFLDVERVGTTDLTKPDGGTYLCARAVRRLDAEHADGWVIGKIRKTNDGWKVGYKPFRGPLSLELIVERRTGPL
jgi:hypothetical protein